MSKAISSTKNFIVAIGASAGGLEAIHEFFDAIPATTGASFVIIQHLSPDHKSLLVDLISKHTRMKVYEAEHNHQLKRNCVYVIPNDKFMQVVNRKFVLSDKTLPKAPNNAVDIFLYSLAKEQREDAIAVLLSGTGTDGTKGIKAVKEAGGLVLVQEPGSAKFDGMPMSAITSGNVDHILPTAEIANEVVRVLEAMDGVDDKSFDDKLLQEIFQLIHAQGGLEFHYYKTPTIVRRINHRMMETNFKNIGDYIAFLRSNPDECKQLGKDFLINVTKFFRDRDAFDYLRDKLFPQIIAAKENGEIIKVWVCACSTGEEAFSIAILLDHLIEISRKHIQIKIFASDLERSNIDIASRGEYPLSIAEDVPADFLQRYFVAHKNSYQISQRIRKMIVFAQHNVIKDPPFIKNDFVSCRNMLIYMNTALQQRVYSVLLFSLNLNGHLFLGSSESPQTIKNFIHELHSKFKIYRKTADSRMQPYIGDPSKKPATNPPAKTPKLPESDAGRQRSLWEDFRETIISDFNFAAFYIDRNFEIKEAIGNFDKILSIPKKILKLNLLRMLPGYVSSMLMAEIKAAWSNNEKKIVRNIHFKHETTDLVMQIMIKPDTILKGKQFTLVAFHFMPIEDQLMTESVQLISSDPAQNDYVIALEEELNDAKTSLQQLSEDFETANEELQSSNEELLSANEELQSSNEELQSLNEELHTLNSEHQIKIRELIELNDDLNNYFRSSDIGQVFLDKNLLIRKFNPASARMINFIDSDIGRPLSHISTNIRYNGLMNDVNHVMLTNEIVEREVLLVSGQNMLMRIMPYLTQEHQNAGLIITLIDITAITELNNIVRGVFNSSLGGIFVFQAVRSGSRITDFKVVSSNRAAAEIMGEENANMQDKFLQRDFRNSVFATLFERYTDVVYNDKTLYTEAFDDSRKRWFEVTAVKMNDGFVSTLTDITQRRNAEDRLKKNYVELVTAKETLRKLNTELEAKINERTQLLTASEERFRLTAKATNDVLWDWDIVNNRIWFSEAFHTKFGYEQSDTFARQFWLDRVHPDDRAAVQNSVNKTLDGGKHQWTCEYRFRKANGEYATVLDRGYVLQDDYQTPFRMLGSMLDLTTLRKTQEELASNIQERRFLAESMPLMVWTTSADGHVEYINRYVEQYTGTKTDDILTHGWLSFISEDDRRQAESRWKSASKSGEYFEMEVRVLHGNEYRWNVLRANPRKNAEDIIGWVMTTIDVHLQKTQNEELERTVLERTSELQSINRALEVSNHELQQFASVASHDLQEPLRKIHLFAELIRERYSEKLDGANSYLNKIMHSAERMQAIIRSILHFSRLSVHDISFKPTDFNKIIENIIDDLEVSIQSKQTEINVSPIPLIEAIPGQIHQVFLNLISNSLKFSRPGVKPKIWISSERVDSKDFGAAATEEGSYCRITVRDNGIGFEKEFQERIFVLFQRLHTKDQYEGTGIGLAIVKKIIEKHNGLIKADGVDGSGATFTIILPMLQSIENGMQDQND